MATSMFFSGGAPPENPTERHVKIDWSLVRTTVALSLRRRRVVAANDIDDVVQATMAKFAALLDNNNNNPIRIDSPVGFAVKMAERLAIDHYRRCSSSREIPAGSSADLDLFERTPVFHQPSSTHEQRTDLRRLVAKVAPDMAGAMRLFLLGHSITEIATITRQPRESIYAAFRTVALQLDSNTRPTDNALGTTDEDDDDTIVQIFQTLGKRQSEVLRLSAEGLKPREIAEILGIDKNCVRASKSIALKTIREHVGAVDTEEILTKVRTIAWRTEAHLAS